MRLINVRTQAIEEFFGTNVPPYAILSHTWGVEEVTFQDWHDLSIASSKKGFAKIQGACKRATKDNLDYIWVDTNCIDKTSSAELSEAINSMFAWYRDASVCYAYLADAPDPAPKVSTDHELAAKAKTHFWKSKWFTRGWTLQELLAPQNVIFFSTSWVQLGTKEDFHAVLTSTTGIECGYLTGSVAIWQASLAERMSWMSKRVTTRVEDMAYCMLGLFEINMPLLYGEGSRAFLRLQEEILKATDDQSIFCWEWDRTQVADDWANILAPCPAVFKRTSSFFYPTASGDHSEIVPYSITNVGLSVTLPVIQTADPNFVFGVLNVTDDSKRSMKYASKPHTHKVCIPLQKARIYRRLPFPTTPFLLHTAMAGKEKSVYIASGTKKRETRALNFYSRVKLPTQPNSIKVPNLNSGFLLAFEPTSSDINPPSLRYCTPGVRFIPEQSVLAFSCDPAESTERFAAGILQLNHVGCDTSLVLLAVRRCKALDCLDVHGFKFYCQVVPQTLVNAAAAGLQLSEIVREAEISSLRVKGDVNFSSDEKTTVALSDVTYDREEKGFRLRPIRVASIVGCEKRLGTLLKRYGVFPVSLFRVDDHESIGTPEPLSQYHAFLST